MAEDPIFYAWQHDDLEALADLAKSYRDGRDDLRAHSAEVTRSWRRSDAALERAEADVRALRDAVEFIVAEVRALRDVVDAARAWANTEELCSCETTERGGRLLDAINAYEAATADPTPPHTNPLQTQWTRPADPKEKR